MIQAILFIFIKKINNKKKLGVTVISRIKYLERTTQLKRGNEWLEGMLIFYLVPSFKEFVIKTPG